jgi:hypothetical protein
MLNCEAFTVALGGMEVGLQLYVFLALGPRYSWGGEALAALS